MEARGFEQKDLADLMKVNISTVSRWISGAAPDPDELARLATVLGVTTDDLLRPGAQALVIREGGPAYGAETITKKDLDLLLRTHGARLRAKWSAELRAELANELQRALDRWARKG